MPARSQQEKLQRTLGATLSADRTHVRPGESVRFTLAVRNDSARAVVMAGVLDGSENLIRYPHYRVCIEGPPGFVADAAPPFCGMVAPLLPAELLSLAPGQSFDPLGPVAGGRTLRLRALDSLVFSLPGRYRIWVAISTLSESEEDWLGWTEYPDKPIVLERLRRVPRLEFETNRLEIEAVDA